MSLVSRLLFLCALVLTSARAADLPVTFGVDAQASWVDNISRTSNLPDQREAARYSATAAANTFRNWKTGIVTFVDAHAGFNHTPDYELTDATTAGLTLGARHRFGLGAFAPTLALSADADYRHARLEADRGWTQTLRLQLSKRFLPTLRASLHGAWLQHDARRATFDVSHRRFGGQLTWDFLARWQLAAGAARLSGYFTANAAGPTWGRALAGDFGAAIESYYNSVARQTTHLYGPNWVTYRVSGDTNLTWFELSPALGRNTSLPLRFERADATNRVGVKYRQESLTLSLVHRF